MKEPCRLQVGGKTEDGRDIGMLITDANGKECFYLGACIYSNLEQHDVEAIQQTVIGGLLNMKNPDPPRHELGDPKK